MKQLVLLAAFLSPTCAVLAQDFSELVRTATVEEIQEALARGADVEVTDFPFWKVTPFRAEAARQYQIDTEGLTPLMLAAAFNHDARVISVLLKAGARIDDKDYKGGTPLMWAAEYNSNPAVISVLLAAGAHVDDRTAVGVTALMLSARSNANPLVISVLLRSGAKIEDRDADGYTPLMWAAENNKRQSSQPSWREGPGRLTRPLTAGRL